jgi:hypothetical protein
MKITGVDPGHYLTSIADDDIRSTMIELDTIIGVALPERQRDLWQGIFWGGTEQTIIGYGRLLQPRPRGTDVKWFLVGLARQKRNYSLYVNATSEDHYLTSEYADRLGNVKLGAASIGFTRLTNVEPAALRELLTVADESTPKDAW